MKNIHELEKELDLVEHKIQELEEALDELYDQRSDLENAIDEKSQEEKTKEFLGNISGCVLLK